MQVKRQWFMWILLCLPHWVFADPNDTEAYYLCANKVTNNTSWNFGTAPAYCDIAPFGDPLFVQDYLNTLVFDSRNDTNQERRRYMDELHAVIRDSASYYLAIRKPNAAVNEQQAWLHAIKAVANQETFWSHYRYAQIDSRMKMMRGDTGHGHGMMQIDDRWHFTQINEGKGWQIFENMLYAMEIFYAEWQNAAQASCVDAADNWQQRTRAAYSAYNGGPSRICRWRDAPVWQDDTFFEKYQAESWQDHIADENKQASVDAECMLEGVEFCLPDYIPPTHTINNPEFEWQFNYLELASGETCLLDGGELHCVAQQQDAACLNARFQRVSIAQAIQLTAEQSSSYSVNHYEKHQCMAFLANAFTVGESIKAGKDINIRTTAAGADTGINTVVGKVYQILDIVAGTPADQSRYYRIRYADTNEGYIYAGGLWDFDEWAAPVPHSELSTDERIIAMTGDEVYIVAEDGIAVKDGLGNDALNIGNLAKDTKVVVLDTSVIGVDNQVYFQVAINGVTGYMYAGKLLPESTLPNWTSFSQQTPPPAPAPTPTPQPIPPANNPDSSGGSAFVLLLLTGVGFIRRLKHG